MHEDKPQLRAILDKAICGYQPAQRAYLDNTWFNFEDDARIKTSSVVPGGAMVKSPLEDRRAQATGESPPAGQNWLLCCLDHWQQGRRHSHSASAFAPHWPR